jgi:hypothetical protein
MLSSRLALNLRRGAYQPSSRLKGGGTADRQAQAYLFGPKPVLTLKLQMEIVSVTV